MMLDEFLKNLGDPNATRDENVIESVLFQPIEDEKGEEDDEETEDDMQQAISSSNVLERLERCEAMIKKLQSVVEKWQTSIVTSSATNVKKTFQNEEEKLIHDLITEFLTSWNKTFRCSHFYRGDCRFEESTCYRIHDNSPHALLAKEIRSVLLTSQSQFFFELINKCKNTGCNSTCESICLLLKDMCVRFGKFTDSNNPNKRQKTIK